MAADSQGDMRLRISEEGMCALSFVVSRLGSGIKLIKASSGEIKPVLALLASPWKLAYELAEKVSPPSFIVAGAVA